MKKSILFNVRPYQTRVAYTEDGVLTDLLYHRDKEPSLVGGIYKGKVAHSPAGVNFVFIDLGLKRSGFLYKKRKSHRSKFKAGEVLLVQIVSDPIYEKGSRLTADISLSSRFLAYLPQQEKKVTVSRRISDDKEKKRLSKLVEKFDEPGTFIIRTLAKGQSEKELKKDLKALKKEWEELQSQFKDKKDIGEIRKGLGPELAYLQDYMNDGIDELVVDQKEAFSSLKEFIKNYMPEFLPRLKLFSGKEPLFESLNLESQIQEACQKRVRFKGGGFLIFEELETLVVIDVNTGRYMGKKDPKETILKTNLLAAQTLARHIRLRHLGGIITIDFIDMEDEEERKKVVSVLEKELASDKAHPRIFPMSELGIVQITRKRMQPALSLFTSQSCPSCKSEGRIKSHLTIISEIFIALEKAHNKKSFKEKQKISVFCHSEIKNRIEKEEGKTLDFLKKELSIYPEFISQNSSSLETFKIKKS